MSDRVDLNHFTSRKTTLPWSFHLNLLTSVEQLKARMKDYGESWKMCLFVCSDSEVNKLSEEFSKEWIYNKCIWSIRNWPYEKTFHHLLKRSNSISAMSVLLNCQEKWMTWTCDNTCLERNGSWTALWGLKRHPTGYVLAPNPKISLTAANVWWSARLLFSQLLGNTPRRQIRCLLPLNSSEFPALPYGAWDRWTPEQGTQGHNTSPTVHLLLLWVYCHRAHKNKVQRCIFLMLVTVL